MTLDDGPRGWDNRMSGLPGDDIERSTRASFTAAAQASLSIVRDAAATTPAAREEPSWRPPGVADRTHAWRRNPASATAAQGLDAGWLVTSGASAAPASPGQLSGIRVAVKDVIDVAGLPTRNGTPGATWRNPERSASAWRRLADEGAECVGKAATHELAWGVTTATVAHPLDPDRMPGGSSGGSAACVAAGVADAALGTDTGGSIRIPASLCGVVGLRPTVDTVPSQGISPLAPTQDVAGPLAHDVATCAAMAEVLLNRPLGRRDRAPTRVGVLGSPGPLDDPTAEAWRQTVADLRGSGAEVVEIDSAPLRLAGAVSLLTMLWESAQGYATAVAAHPAGFGGEARALATLGLTLAADVAMLEAARLALRDETARMFREHGLDAVLTPTTACVAPRRDATTVTIGGREIPVATALTRYTAWAAATGLPAVSVPAGVTGELPVGIQVMAQPGDEASCLVLAHVIEDHGRNRPT